MQRLSKGPFFLQNTKLSWIVSGPTDFNTRINDRSLCNFAHSIDTQLRQFWKLEKLPQVGHRIFMPLEQSPSKLGELFSYAERRFIALERIVPRKPSYKKLNTDFIHEPIDLGHMTRVDSCEHHIFFTTLRGVLRAQHHHKAV